MCVCSVEPSHVMCCHLTSRYCQEWKLISRQTHELTVISFMVFNCGSSHYAVNACLAPVCSLHMVAVTTVEGIGSVAKKLHPVQVTIV